MWASLAGVFAAGLVAVGSSGVAAALSPGDVATTDAYLRALKTYYIARQATAAQLEAAAAAYAAYLGRECPPVPAEAQPHGNVSSRVFGEEALRREQRSELYEELKAGSLRALAAPRRSAFEAFAAAVSPLRWSDPRLGQVVARHLAAAGANYLALPLPVCADIGAWLSNPRHLLSTSTKSFLASEETRRQQERSIEIPVLLDRALRADVDAEDRSLLAALHALEIADRKVTQAAERTVRLAEKTIGLSPLGFASSEEGEETHIERVGRGKTEAGGEFNVEVLTRPRHGHCRFRLQVSRLSGFETAKACLPVVQTSSPRSSCAEELHAVAALLPASVRSVRLLTTTGRAFTSPTIAIPARLGGPAAYYLQALRPADGVPKTLTELDAHGGVVRTVSLPPPAHACIRQSVQFLPHGIQIVARGAAPGGPSFAIQGEAFRWRGMIQFHMQVQLSDGSGGGTNFSGRRSSVFERAIWSQCSPHQYEIVYGVLRAPGASVTARAAGSSTPLTEAPIPARLHAGGILVYGAFAAPPEALIITDAHGRTLLDEDMHVEGREETEYCEGRTEEPGQPVRESGISIGF